MKKTDPSNGFLMNFLLNLVLHFQWGLVATVFLLLHWFLDLPLMLAVLVYAAWAVYSLVLSVLVRWGNQSAKEETPRRPNKNPYSAKTRDFLPDAGETQDEKALRLAMEARKPLLDALPLAPEQRGNLEKLLRSHGDASLESALSLMVDQGYLRRFSEAQPYTEVIHGIETLTRKMNTAALPRELATDDPGLQGLAAVSYLARIVDSWRIFVILAADGGFYKNGFGCGIVKKEDADDLAARLNSSLEGKWSAVLLDGPELDVE